MSKTTPHWVRKGCRAMALLLGLSVMPAMAAEWPTRPVTIVVPAGAGGGSDGTARILAKYLKDEFGQQFNVLNLGQGGGVVGINRIVNSKPDGYTLGVLFNYAHYKEMGQADFELKDFTPIAQYNFDPAGFQVRTDSPFKTVNQALDAIKAEPGKYTIACAGGCGGSWPVAVATLLDRWGVDMAKVRMIPGQGRPPPCRISPRVAWTSFQALCLRPMPCSRPAPYVAWRCSGPTGRKTSRKFRR